MESQLQDSNIIGFEDRSQTDSFKFSVPALTADSARETAATLLVNRIYEGLIFATDRKFIAGLVREAWANNNQRILQQDVNELLSARGSEHRLLLDDSLIANSSPVAGTVLDEEKQVLFIYIIERITGRVTSGMSAVCSRRRINATPPTETVPVPPLHSQAVSSTST
ncbi:MAG: hypothetical protein K2W95_18105 [Candidatus Obscuribacterales bacterium]|nr:hypothetical protein [Candidatus Obscuribacterales bacterium]